MGVNNGTGLSSRNHGAIIVKTSLYVVRLLGKPIGGGR